VAGLREEVELRNKRAVILGAAFKANSDDARQSLSYKVRKALLRERCQVVMHDPHVRGLDGDLSQLLRGADVVFVATNHAAYKQVSLQRLHKWVGQDCIVCDIWNIFGTDRIIFRLDAALSAREAMALAADAGRREASG